MKKAKVSLPNTKEELEVLKLQKECNKLDREVRVLKLPFLRSSAHWASLFTLLSSIAIIFIGYKSNFFQDQKTLLDIQSHELAVRESNLSKTANELVITQRDLFIANRDKNSLDSYNRILSSKVLSYEQVKKIKITTLDLERLRATRAGQQEVYSTAHSTTGDYGQSNAADGGVSAEVSSESTVSCTIVARGGESVTEGRAEVLADGIGPKAYNLNGKNNFAILVLKSKSRGGFYIHVSAPGYLPYSHGYPPPLPSSIIIELVKANAENSLPK